MQCEAVTCNTYCAIDGTSVQEIWIHTLMQAGDMGGQAGQAEDRQKAVKIFFLDSCKGSKKGVDEGCNIPDIFN